MKLNYIIISIVLSTLILFSTTRLSVTYAYYELDPIGFIENLCKNKDKPELACNGKCHLKKVTENSSDKQNSPVNTTALKEITLYNVTKLEYKLVSLFVKKNVSFNYSNLYAYSSVQQIDHPPQV